MVCIASAVGKVGGVDCLGANWKDAGDSHARPGRASPVTLKFVSRKLGIDDEQEICYVEATSKHHDSAAALWLSPVRGLWDVIAVHAASEAA